MSNVPTTACGHACRNWNEAELTGRSPAPSSWSDDTFEWRAALREHALDLKALFERHPWSVELWLRSIPGPRRFDLMEWQLAAFAASGLSEQDAHKAYHALFNHTVGFMLQRQAMTFTGDDAAVNEMISTLDPDRHAHVLHHVDQHRAKPREVV